MNLDKYPLHKQVSEYIVANPEAVKLAKWSYHHFGLSQMFDADGEHCDNMEVEDVPTYIAAYLQLDLPTFNTETRQIAFDAIGYTGEAK